MVEKDDKTASRDGQLADDLNEGIKEDPLSSEIITDSIEVGDFSTLEKVETETRDKLSFGRKIFRIWKATRIKEMEKALRPPISTFFSISLEEKKLKLNHLVEEGKRNLIQLINFAPELSRSHVEKATNNKLYQNVVIGNVRVKNKNDKFLVDIEKSTHDIIVKKYSEKSVNKIVAEVSKSSTGSFFLKKGDYEISIGETVVLFSLE